VSDAAWVAERAPQALRLTASPPNSARACATASGLSGTTVAPMLNRSMSSARVSPAVQITGKPAQK
jgi:hypothetical protein